MRQSSRFLAEHPLAGAGSVYQYRVEKTGQPAAQRFDGGGGDHGIAYAAAFQVLLQNSGAAADVFVGPEQAAAIQRGGDLGGFSAGCGAEIQYPFSRPGGQHGHGGHGGRLLHIIGPCVMKRISAGTMLRRQKKAGGGEGQRFQRQGKQLPQPMNAAFQGIDPQSSPERSSGIGGQKGILGLLSQQPEHPFSKALRKQLVGPFFHGNPPWLQPL